MRPVKTDSQMTATMPAGAVFPELDYPRARRFVELQYFYVHRARIECDFPTLMVVSNSLCQPLAVAGIRAPMQQFFLEQYLDASAQQILSTYFGQHIQREKIVEIGNLAGGKDRLATTFLMHTIWEYLIRCGFEYVMLTGTRTLLHKFRQLPLHHLTDASAEQIPDPSRWGNYYQQSPRVVTGRLADYDFRFFRRQSSQHYQTEILTGGDET